MRVALSPDVLKWAREKSGLSLSEAATKLGVTNERLEDIEAGKDSPTAGIFRAMAKKYGLPEATLMLAEPIELPNAPVDHRTVGGRNPRLSHDIILAVRKVRFQQEALAELAKIDSQITPPQLPELRMETDDPFKAGEEERQRLGFPIEEQLRIDSEQAFIYWRVIIENLKIAVCTANFNPRDSRGISFYDNQFPAILIPRQEGPEAKSFSLMHEYAHLLLRDPGISDHRRRSPIEQYCNRFAAAFLMPNEALQRVLGVRAGQPVDYPVDELEQLSRRLCVSMRALALRLEETRCAPAGYYRHVDDQLQYGPVDDQLQGRPEEKKSGGNKRSRAYAIIADKGHYFADTVLDSLRRDVISNVDAVRLINAKENQFGTTREVIGKRRDKVKELMT